MNCAKIFGYLKKAEQDIVKPSETNADLDEIYKALEKEKDVYSKEIVAFKKIRSDFSKIHSDIQLPDEDKSAEINHNDISANFKIIMSEIKESLSLPEYKIQELIHKTNVKLHEEFNQINMICKDVREAKEDQERNVAAFKMYSETIRMLQIQVNTLNQIKADIRDSIQEEAIAEEVFRLLFKGLSLCIQPLSLLSTFSSLSFTDEYQALVASSVESEIFSEHILQAAILSKLAEVKETQKYLKQQGYLTEITRSKLSKFTHPLKEVFSPPPSATQVSHLTRGHIT